MWSDILEHSCQMETKKVSCVIAYTYKKHFIRHYVNELVTCEVFVPDLGTVIKEIKNDIAERLNIKKKNIPDKICILWMDIIKVSGGMK